MNIKKGNVLYEHKPASYKFYGIVTALFFGLGLLCLFFELALGILVGFFMSLLLLMITGLEHQNVFRIYENGIESGFIIPSINPFVEPYGTGVRKGFKFIEFNQITKIHPMLVSFDGIFSGTLIGLRFIVFNGKTKKGKDKYIIAQLRDYGVPDFPRAIDILKNQYGENWNDIFEITQPLMTKHHTIEEFKEKWPQ